MSEIEKTQSNENYEGDASVSENDELDLGSASADEFDPFADTDFADETDEPASKKEVEKPKTTEKTSKPSVKKNPEKEEIPANPLEKAIDAAEVKDAEDAQKNLYAKLPMFSYAAANEEVEDTSKTFEDLRIEKSSDFPELEDGKRVTWTVEYGKITKNVPNPKGTTIGKMKSDIEMSKEFLDSLKKSKEKEPVCKLKPKVMAQTKGKLPSYKGVFTSIEDAEASGKLITLFPAADGKVYEMRTNEMGKFITPIKRSDILSEVTAGFIPALPPVPYRYLLHIISFFRMMAHEGNYEALVNIYWDTLEKHYVTDVPKQLVTPVSVDSEPTPEYENDRYIHYMDIHSHNKMKAFFSPTDNRDEKATRVYAVIGDVLSYFPQIKVRISNGGTFLEIEPGVVFEDFNYHMELALLCRDRVEVKNNAPNVRENKIRVFRKMMDLSKSSAHLPAPYSPPLEHLYFSPVRGEDK